MRLRTLFRRLAVPAVIGSLALFGTALPAQADELDVPLVGIISPETVTVINGQSKTVKVELINVGGPAKDVVLQFGDSQNPVSPDLGFTPPAGCQATKCEFSSLKPGERRILKFTVKPAPPAGASPVQVLQMVTLVDGLISYAVDMAVVRTAKGGADLEIGDIADMKLGRGQSAEVPVLVGNTGNQDVKAVALLVMPIYGTSVEPVLNYRNCDTDEGALICVFNEPLAAGGTFTLPAATPLKIRAAADAAGPFDYPIMVAAVGLTKEYAFDFAARTAGAKGAELKLEGRATASANEPDPAVDLNEEDNLTDFTVAVPKSVADGTAVGGVFRGAVGDTKSVKVGVRNLGPTAVVPATMETMPFVHVRMPSGIALREVDERCLSGTSLTDVDEESYETSLTGRDYVCLLFEGLPKDARELFTFTGEILDGEHRAGTVTVDVGVQDSRSGNDKAALTVELTGGGSGGGLPITGAPAGLVAGAGALLLVAGAVAYGMARRRRIVTVVE